MQNPTISILVPVYNVEKYLRQCLDSIIAQTFRSWECVLVDDGSSDNSGNICEEYSQKDNRFVVIHKNNEGVAQARITAFEHSRGDLITFIDSDDFVASDYLEKLSRPILEDGADMVSCDYTIIKKGIKQEPPHKLTGIYNKSELLDFLSEHYFYDFQTKGYGMTCYLWTKMVKREFVLKGLRNGIGLWFGEDQISMIAMLIQCKKMILLSDRLYFYVQHEGQAIKQYDESLWDNICMLLSKYCEMLPEGFSHHGLRKRTWIFIETTIFCKMTLANLDENTFIRHISRMRKNSYMRIFFNSCSIEGDCKTNVKYWLLKLRMFRLFFFLCVRH